MNDSMKLAKKPMPDGRATKPSLYPASCPPKVTQAFFFLFHDTMETFTYKQFPETHRQVHVALFKNVKNAAQLRTRIVQAATLDGPDGDAERAAVNFAFVEAKLVR